MTQPQTETERELWAVLDLALGDDMVDDALPNLMEDLAQLGAFLEASFPEDQNEVINRIWRIEARARAAFRLYQLGRKSAGADQATTAKQPAKTTRKR